MMGPMKITKETTTNMIVPSNPRDEPVLPVRRVFDDVRSRILKNVLPTNINILKIMESYFQYAAK